MNKLILIPCFIILFTSLSFSQVKKSENKPDNSGYWNASFSAGPMYTLDKTDFGHVYYPGYNAGFEIFYTMKDQKSSIIFGFSFSKAQAHDFENNLYKQSGFTEKKEFTFGPRFYLGKGYFVEAALEDFLSSYNFRVTEDKAMVGLGHSDITYAGAGGALGAGRIFRLSQNTGLIVKARFSFGFLDKKAILNSILNAGIIFNNRETGNETEQKLQKSNWSFTVSGGFTNPEFFHSANYNIAGNFGFEAAFRNTSKSELFWNLNYNKVSVDNNFLNTRNIIDITFGPRFFFGNNKIAAFTEIGAGLYFYNHIREQNIKPNAMVIGGKVGPGMIFGISKHIAITAKSDMHLVFDEGRHPGGFLTVSGGLKYML